MKRILIATIAAPVLAAVVAPAMAEAHAVLVSSRPANGATVTAGAEDIELRFDSRIDARRSRLRLRFPDGREVVLKPAAASTPAIMTAHVGDLGSGAYTLDYQVLAIDGHITRGAIGFTVTKR